MSAPATEHEAEADRHARPRNIVVRASAEYNAWLDRLAVVVRMPVSLVVDHALAEYAQRHGHEQPPKR